MAIVELRYDVKPVSFVADNPTLVLADGEPIYLEDGSYAFGDGSSQLSELTFFSPGTQTTRVLSGGNITVDDISGSPGDNDVVVASSVYFISGQGSFSSSETTFEDIDLSSSGTQRFVGFFGNTDGEIVKVEGDEAAAAAYPETPADTCPIGYVLVSDGSIGSPQTPGSVNFEDIGGNASDNAALVGFVKNPRVTTITSSATPSINVDLYDILYISALATNITSITVTGTLTPFRPILVIVKDNGVSRTLSFGSSFVAMGESLPTVTTASKVTTAAFLYYPSKSKLGCVGVKLEA